MLNPWLGLAILLMLQLAWWLLVRTVAGRMDAELSRKLFHSGNGAILLLLPLLVHDSGIVLLWGLLNIALLFSLMLFPRLRDKAVGHLYDVDRVSYGDIYFVIGVVILFFFAQSTYYTFAVPLTLLSFADAVSALVGKHFGRHKFQAAEGRKSYEGSIAFFGVAFLAALCWGPTLANPNWIHLVLIATTLGFLTMLLEAVAWRGLDNLLVPLGGYLLLYTFLKMDLQELLINLAAAVLLVAFVLSWRGKTTLNDSALIAAAFFAYVVWTVAGEQFGRHAYGPAGWTWLIIPVLLFVLYNLMFAPQLMHEHHEAHNVDTVLSALFAGAVWLCIAFLWQREDFIFPYAVAFAAVTLNMFLEQRPNANPARSKRITVLTWTTVALMISVGLAVVLLQREQHVARLDAVPILALAAALGILLALGIRSAIEHLLSYRTDQRYRWHIRAGTSLLASVVAALPLLYGIRVYP